jgi:hypothetical protein
MAGFTSTTKLVKGLTALTSFLVLSFTCAMNSVTAQTATTPVITAPPPSVSIESRPTWLQLTKLQQAALQPIQADWSTLDASRKKKWLAIAQRYQKMTPEDQSRMHSRMSAWSKLTPIQRTQARDNYSSVLSSPSSSADATGKANLNEQWAKYQALSPERKNNLAEQANKATHPSKTRPLTTP